METFWRHWTITEQGGTRKYLKLRNGEVTERLKVHDWKSCVPLKGYRGFESPPLRQNLLAVSPDPTRITKPNAVLDYMLQGLPTYRS